MAYGSERKKRRRGAIIGENNGGWLPNNGNVVCGGMTWPSAWRNIMAAYGGVAKRRGGTQQSAATVVCAASCQHATAIISNCGA